MLKAETMMSAKTVSCSCSTNLVFAGGNSGWTNGKVTCTALDVSRGSNMSDYRMSSISMMINELSVANEKNKFLQSFDASCMVSLCPVCNRNTYRATSMETATVDDMSVISQASQTGKGFNSFLRNIFVSNAIAYCQISFTKGIFGQVMASVSAGQSSSSSSAASSTLKCDGVLFAVGSSQGMLLIYRPEREMKRSIWDARQQQPVMSSRITSSKGGRNFQLLNKQQRQTNQSDVGISRGKSVSLRDLSRHRQPSVQDTLLVHQGDLSRLCMEENIPTINNNTDSRMEIKSNGSSKFEVGREGGEEGSSQHIQRLSQDSNTGLTIPALVVSSTTDDNTAMVVEEDIKPQGNITEMQVDEEAEDNATITTLIDPIEEGLDMLIDSALESDKMPNTTEDLQPVEAAPAAAAREQILLTMAQKQMQSLPESIQQLLINCIEDGNVQTATCASQLLQLALSQQAPVVDKKKGGKASKTTSADSNNSKVSKKIISNLMKVFKAVLKARLGTNSNLLAVMSRTSMLHIHLLLAVGHEQLRDTNNDNIFCTFQDISDYLSTALDRLQLALGSPHFPMDQAEQLLYDPSVTFFAALPPSQQQELNAIEIMQRVIDQLRAAHGHTPLWSYIGKEIDARDTALKSQSPSPVKAPLQIVNAESRANSGSSVPPQQPDPVVEQVQKTLPEPPATSSSLAIPTIKAITLRRQTSQSSLNYHAGRAINKAVTMLPNALQRVPANKPLKQPILPTQPQRRVSPRRISAALQMKPAAAAAAAAAAAPLHSNQPVPQDLDVIPVLGKQAKRTRSLPSTSKHRLLSPSPKKRKIVLPSHGNDENLLFASPSRLIHSPEVQPGTESLFERQRAATAEDSSLRSPVGHVQSNLFLLES